MDWIGLSGMEWRVCRGVVFEGERVQQAAAIDFGLFYEGGLMLKW